MNKIIVSIITENDYGEVFQIENECINIIDATRFVLTYKPKKGYEMVYIWFDFIETLV